MNASLLNANMEHLATLDPPLVLPSLPPLPGGFGPVPSDFQPAAPSIVLQVNSVEDVSLPLAHRLRAMAPPGEPLAAAPGELPQPPAEDDAAAPRRGRRKRLLRLTLSDGFTRVAAVEDCRGGCDALRGGVAWGAKLRVAAPLVVRHGVLVLTSHGTELLGGCVAELQAFWERHAVEALARLSGRPQRCVQENGEGMKEREEGTERPQESIVEHSNSHIQQYQQSNHHYHQHQHHQDIHQQSNLHNHYHHRHHSVPALPIVSARPASPQPLAAWASHQPSTAPFTTIAVIAEVTSELTIREPDTQFSLLVLLAPPGSAGDEEDGIVVDLGHAWLRSALGMDPEAFRALSTSRRPEDIARLSEIVEGVGRTLENFGEGVFVLRLRAADGVVEVMEARQRHQ